MKEHPGKHSNNHTALEMRDVYRPWAKVAGYAMERFLKYPLRAGWGQVLVSSMDFLQSL